MISMSRLRGFLHKEFKQALRDPRMKIILFIVPIIQLMIFGVAISTDVKNITLWAKISPHDFILQHIYDHSIQSKWFLPTPYDYNADPYELLRAGKINAALIPPPGGLTQALGKNQGELQILIDATNVLQAQSIESYIKTLVNQVIQDDLKLPTMDPPINFVVRVLYNPILETAYFMVPGVMCMLMCVTTVMLTSMSITREKELGTFEMLISAPASASEIVLGKTIPFVVLGMLNVPLLLSVAAIFFNVPMRGSLLVLTFASFAFVCATVAIGTLISTISENQQQATLGGFLFLFPAIMFSGLMFPLENMPAIMKWVAYLDPLSHFLSLLRNIMLIGGETSFIIQHISVLTLMAIIFVGISFKRFKTTLK